MKQYYEYFIAFTKVDKDNDHRISEAEFLNASKVMQKWGIDMSDPKAQWLKCNPNKAMNVTFTEFCEWAIEHNFKIADDYIPEVRTRPPKRPQSSTVYKVVRPIFMTRVSSARKKVEPMVPYPKLAPYTSKRYEK